MDIPKTMEFILDQVAQVAVLQARTDRRLDRAIRFAVQEARQERKRRQETDEILARRAAEADEKITQLAAAQLVTEEKLQRLIEERRGKRQIRNLN
jgi:ATP-dependent Clp protease ATP-binding subunit ClpA